MSAKSKVFQVIRSHNNVRELPALLRSTIQGQTGIAPNWGEPLYDYIARLADVPGAVVACFMRAIEEGSTIEEAERRVPSIRRITSRSLRCVLALSTKVCADKKRRPPVKPIELTKMVAGGCR